MFHTIKAMKYIKLRIDYLTIIKQFLSKSKVSYYALQFSMFRTAVCSLQSMKVELQKFQHQYLRNTDTTEC